MSDPLPSTETDREKLGELLERSSQKLGLKERRFVDTKSLCSTCRWAFIARQASKNHRLINCTGGYPGSLVPDDIVECNSYSNVIELSLSQMADIVILINEKERKVGFHKQEET